MARQSSNTTPTCGGVADGDWNGRHPVAVQSPFALVALVTLMLVFAAFSGCTASRPGVSPPPPPEDYYDQPVEEDDYFEDLSYYGSWIEFAPFGTVWRPLVVADWRPYHHGHWVWTDLGWTWISYEPFGWATYHYGYWHYDPGWGWLWMPGDEWAPAYVQWVWFDDYVGWTPLAPPGYIVVDPWVLDSPDVWVVVPFKYLVRDDLANYTVKSTRSLYKNKPVPASYHQPPTTKIVERYTRRPIARVDIKVENFKAGNRMYKRVVLPPSQQRTVENYKRETEEKVLKREVEKKKAVEEKPRPAEPKKKEKVQKPPQKQQPEEPDKKQKKPKTEKTKNSKKGAQKKKG